MKAWKAHLAIGPTFEIGDREAFEEWVGFDDFIPLGPARCVGIGHNQGSVGIIQRRQDRHSSRATSEVSQVESAGRYR
jgi:hypothetical protein